jgi:hypothetical protein
VNGLLGKLHEGTRWPIEQFRPSGDDTADMSVLHHSYIMFVWNEEAGSSNEKLEIRWRIWNTAHRGTPGEGFLWWQLRGTMNRYTYWLLTYVPYCGRWPEFSTWWYWSQTNLLSEPQKHRKLTGWTCTLGSHLNWKGVETYKKSFYWWMGHWTKWWIFTKCRSLLCKLSKNFKCCPIKVGAVGIDPDVIMTEIYTQNYGRFSYMLTGLSVEIVHLVCEKKN